MKNEIYVVMGCTRLEEDKTTKFPDLGNTAIFGWFSKFLDAEYHVMYNILDIHETCYDYVVIEASEEGFYPASTERWWYGFNNEIGEYYQIEEPKFLKHFSGLVM